ncbi:MAG: hypothetical protein ACE5EB_05900 [Thermodesulfobacteriota bacterium]
MKDREVKYMGYTYEVQNWQGLLQQLVNYTSLGYTKYCAVEYPERKHERFSAIDRKIIAKYHVDKSKDQRSRLKKKGYANFVFLRWDKYTWVLQSPGVVREDILYDDIFHSFPKMPIEVKVGTNMCLLVGRFGKGGGISVKMTPETYREVKAGLREVAATGDRNRCVREFNKLNGLPAWHGIVEQKVRLAEYLVKQARSHQVKLSRRDLRINTMRKVYPVWKDRGRKKG